MLSRDFKEFVELLNSNSVEYLIVGGYALAVHGRPRYTGDLYIWLSTEAGSMGTPTRLKYSKVGS